MRWKASVCMTSLPRYVPELDERYGDYEVEREKSSNDTPMAREFHREMHRSILALQAISSSLQQCPGPPTRYSRLQER